MSDTEAPKRKKLVDPLFAKRLEMATYRHPRAPAAHGRQRFVREELEAFGQHVSSEAVRKWFSGQARPRPTIMSKLAQALAVDEAWLSLGINPTHTPLEKKRHNALASGAVNIVAGLFQLAGGTIAFTQDADSGHDFMLIIEGRSFPVQVKYAPKENTAKVAIDSKFAENGIVVLVVGSGANISSFEFLRIPTELMFKHGRRKGIFLEVSLDKTGDLYRIDSNYLPVISDFSKPDGIMPSASDIAYSG